MAGSSAVEREALTLDVAGSNPAPSEGESVAMEAKPAG